MQKKKSPRCKKDETRIDADRRVTSRTGGCGKKTRDVKIAKVVLKAVAGCVPQHDLIKVVCSTRYEEKEKRI